VLDEDEKEMEAAKKTFIEECNKQLIVVLPLLLRIKEQHLILNAYSLSTGLCKGVQMALIKFPVMLRKITLVSNGLTDETFSIILKGLND
jgi:hypothetical protein